MTLNEVLMLLHLQYKIEDPRKIVRKLIRKNSKIENIVWQFC